MRSQRGTLAGIVLYDVSSARSRGGPAARRDRSPQRRGAGPPADRLRAAHLHRRRPVAIEVFEGNTGNRRRSTARWQAQAPVRPYRLIIVGDGHPDRHAAARGCEPCWPDWIIALRARSQALIRDDALQLSLFDEADLAEITHPDYPGEWLPGRTRSWKPSGPANVNHCSPPPRLTWRKSPPLPSGNAGRCAARARSRCAQTGCCAAATSQAFTIGSTDDQLQLHRDLDSSPLKTPWTPSTAAHSVEPAARSGEVVSDKALAHMERASAFSIPTWSSTMRDRKESRVRAHVFLRMLRTHHLAHARPPRAAAVHRR